MSVKVCHISTVHGVFDDRIFFKECRTLANEGYDVYYIVGHDKEEVIDKVHILPLPQNEGRIYRFFGKRWIAFKKANELKADIYHFHDPELVTIGLMLKLSGKRVIYDSHEDVPLQILSKEWLGDFFIRKIISSLFNAFEKSSARKFDGVVTVTEGIKDKFTSCNTELIRNLPIKDMIDAAVPVQIEKQKTVVIYAGGLTRMRGIRELIDAIGLIGGDVELWLLGKFDSTDFQKECQSLDGWQYTRYFGLKSMKEAYSYMKCADIGFCTLYPEENYLSSLPVKAFEYMACGLPMVMSDFPYWVDIFKDCSVFVNPKDSNGIAKKIKYLMGNKERANEMGLNGASLVGSKYSWEAESRVLINLYNRILQQN